MTTTTTNDIDSDAEVLRAATKRETDAFLKLEDRVLSARSSVRSAFVRLGEAIEDTLSAKASDGTLLICLRFGEADARRAEVAFRKSLEAHDISAPMVTNALDAYRFHVLCNGDVDPDETGIVPVGRTMGTALKALSKAYARNGEANAARYAVKQFQEGHLTNATIKSHADKVKRQNGKLSESRSGVTVSQIIGMIDRLTKEDQAKYAATGDYAELETAIATLSVTLELFEN